MHYLIAVENLVLVISFTPTLIKLFLTEFYLGTVVSKWKSRLRLFGKRLAIALGLTMLFALLAIFPDLGYFSKASANVKSQESFGFWIVDVNCNILYNPFLYPFAWLRGRGHLVTSFTMVSVPTYARSEDYYYPLWRMPSELADDAVVLRTTDELFASVPYVFLILLIVGLVGGLGSYLYFIGGILGFAVGGVLGTIVGFLAGALIMIFILPRLKKSMYISKLWRSFLNKLHLGERPK
jgi:hypothetical protein